MLTLLNNRLVQALAAILLIILAYNLGHYRGDNTGYDRKTNEITMAGLMNTQAAAISLVKLDKTYDPINTDIQNYVPTPEEQAEPCPAVHPAIRYAISRMPNPSGTASK